MSGIGKQKSKRNGRAARGARRALALCAAALLALFAALFACDARDARVRLSNDAQPFSGARDAVYVTARVEEDLRRVTGEQRMTLTNRTGQDQARVALRLFPNAVDEDSLVLSRLTVNGEAASFEREPDDKSVLYAPCAWAAGETAELSFHFALTIPRVGSWCARGDGEALCVGALAAPALWQDGAWRLDAWDALAGPLGVGRFDYEMTLDAPQSVLAAFGGAPVGLEKTDGRAVWTVRGEGALDIPFALRLREGLFGAALRQREVSGVLVTALAADAGTARRLLDAAETALESLDAIGLPYDGKALCVAQAETGFARGLAGSGLIAVDGAADGETLVRDVTRLIARQRFGVAAQNDSWLEPWLGLSLASSAELLAYRARKGEAAYEARYMEEIEIASRLTRPAGVTVGAATERFSGEAEMTQVLCEQGAAMLLGIERAVGEEAFVRALTLYCARSANAPASRAGLEAALREATGSDWGGYLQDELTF